MTDQRSVFFILVHVLYHIIQLKVRARLTQRRTIYESSKMFRKSLVIFTGKLLFKDSGLGRRVAHGNEIIFLSSHFLVLFLALLMLPL